MRGRSHIVSEVLVKEKASLLAFITVCVVLAVLLLVGVVTTVVASLLFAAALLLFGFASRASSKGKRGTNDR